MLRAFEVLVEALYLYQQSVYYRLHFVLIVLLTLVVGYIWKKERDVRARMAAREKEGAGRCSQKQDYFQYTTTLQRNTEEAVDKLMHSREYQEYVRKKNDPTSELNKRRQEEDVSEIMFSDEEEDDHHHRKYN